MKIRSPIYLCAAIFLLSACVRSPIDAKKKDTSRTEMTISKNAASQLTDKDIFGNETTLAVSEEDIQAALDGEKFSVPLNSAVILVQSGNRAPEMAMQQEMSRYYRISTFTGIPDRQKAISCNKVKNEEGEVATSENMNYMQALRYIAAKGQQKAVIVYWDTLQSGKYDTTTKSMVWSDYRNEKLSGTDSLRYLVRFALVDVATGEWATWSPVNYEYNILQPLTGKTSVTEQQIAQLKQNTFAAVVKDMVNRYQ
ncbi:hypothetical protein OGJ28_000498 [Salmonella enterica subsp. enterica]|nr:hypothetical protein [Salmonella enterica]ECI8048966.1 hypothetical protein [Salmonella enterica subsp. enterica]ELA5508364.1 hypothetical protein [Salmonella enterica subsp. enterica]ELL8624156.1 hypothetical protein [Salmonella enterica]